MINKDIFPFGIGLITIMVLILSNNKEGFASLIGSMGSMPKNDSLAESGLPLFLNFYPKNLGQDFNLFDYIQKLKFSKYPEPRGEFYTNGVGQFNRKLFKTKKLKPIILVPGLGATKIFGRWSKNMTENIKSVDESGNFERPDSWNCKQVQDSFVKLWYPKNQGLVNTCWADNIRVYPDEVGNIKDTEGVHTTTSEFGSLDFEPDAYMGTLIESLKAMGYVPGENLFGAGYDFRKIGDTKEMDSWCLSLSKLIERSSSLQQHQAVIIGHDLGAVVSNYFLVNALPQWKKTFIDSFVSVSGTFGGCPKALRTVLSGEDIPGASKKEKHNFSELIKNFSGLSLMLPCKEVYGDNPLVHYNDVTYTSYDIPKLLSSVSESSNTVYNSVEHIRQKSMMAPGVPVYILAGDEINTESSYKYSLSLSEDPEKNYPFYQLDLPYDQKFNYPDYYVGDGTMPRFALEYPIFWGKQQKEPVHYQFFVGAEHSKILSMERPIRHIMEILF